MIRGLLLGIVLTVAIIIVGGYAFIKAGAMPANADARPGGLETWAAKTSLHATISHEAPKGENPVAATPQNLQAGMKLYMQNCAVCHGAGTGKATNIADGLYQKPPMLASDGVEDDPAGVTYWKIKHGIRLTGMPAFSDSLNDHKIWQLTAFLQTMDKLPASIDKQWKQTRVSEALAPARVRMHQGASPKAKGS